MTRPSLVIFDMDDVLCHYSLGRRLRELSRLSGASPRDIQAAIWDSGFEGDSDAGGFPGSEEYLREFGLRLGYPITREEWIAARRISMTPNWDVLALAREIGATAKLAVFTNNGPLVREDFASLFPEAAAIFAERHCSSGFGTKKPDPQSYRLLLGHLGHEPKEAWFIDDKRSNVLGARIAGLQAHHFVSAAALRADAQRLELVGRAAA